MISGNNGQAEAEIQNSRVSVGESLWIGDGGRLRLDSGGSITVGNNTAKKKRTIGQNRSFFGSGSIAGDVGSNGFRVPIGQMTITGNYTQSASSLIQINASGSSLGEFDRLSVSDRADLGGTLLVSLPNDAEFKSAESLTILTAGTVDGLFADIITSLPGQQIFSIDVLADRVVLTALMNFRR